MVQKICIITGANSGIGKAASIQIARAGHQVIMACRSKQRGETALKEVQKLSGNTSVSLMLVDMSLQSSITTFSKQFLESYNHVDVLIHNAAHFDLTQKHPQKTTEGIESVWATNHIGPVFMTDLLLPALKTSQQGRLLTVSSKGLIVYPTLQVDLEDPEFNQRKFSVQKAYYQSKLAQVMYTYWLAEQLKKTNVTANCIRVTNVNIDLSRYPHLSWVKRSLYALKSRFSITPEEMAEIYTYLALSDEVKTVNGNYFNEHQQPVQSSSYSRDPEHIKKLMIMTMKYIKRLN